MNRLAATPFVLFVGLLFAIGVAVPASAHTQLTGVDPTEGATVAEGGTVTLTFSESLLTIGAEATVTDSAGVVTPLEVTFPTDSSAQWVFPSMEAGDVTLAWRVVANDGHPVEGTLAYVADAPVTPAQPTALPTPGSTASGAVEESPGATASPSAAPPSPSPAAAEGGASGFNNVALWVAIFAALLASSVAIIAAKRRR